MQQITQEATGRVADSAAGASIVAASSAWIAQANEILTLVATAIAIVSGIFAIAYHVRGIKRQNDKSED